MSKNKRNKEYLEKLRKSDEQIRNGETYEVRPEGLPEKFKDAYFEFKIPPEESELLKAWNELQEDEEFQNKLEEIRKRTEKEEADERDT